MIPNTPQPPQRQVVSVSQLNRRAKQLLETQLPLLWVEGEISNLAQPSSGHWYFTLKDSRAQIRCAMFKNRNMQLRFSPQQGQQVLIRGRISLYEGRGDYQLIAEHMEEAGFGALQREFEALKFKLAGEGLFDEQRKQELPRLPKHIGVITSPTGAAIRDILSVLERRFAGLAVTVIPVPVQGDEAGPAIVGAIDSANRSGLFDCLILARGGGSLEDLWAFNLETVARAIANSKLPIVSAVGHEVDFTIADLVADYRAPTPSAAAETISPDADDWLQTFAGYEVLLEQALERRLQQAGQRIEWLRSRLRSPAERLQHQAQRLDHLELRLRGAINKKIDHKRQQLNLLRNKKQQFHPEETIKQQERELRHLWQRLQHNCHVLLDKRKQTLASNAHILNTVSPLNTLQRGYSITSDQQGKVLQNANQLAIGDRVNTRLATGQFQARIEAID